jgi:hypothetical protein
VEKEWSVSTIACHLGPSTVHRINPLGGQIQTGVRNSLVFLDSGLRRNDEKSRRLDAQVSGFIQHEEVKDAVRWRKTTAGRFKR